MNTLAAQNRKLLFPGVAESDWNDWHWQLKNRLESMEDLNQFVTLTETEKKGVAETLKTLRMAITPYYLTLIIVTSLPIPSAPRAALVKLVAMLKK